MRNETLARHAGFDTDPATRGLAVPICQTVAYGFETAEHAASLFDLETEGYRDSRISDPTNAVREARVEALEGGLEALVVTTGQSAFLPSQGLSVRFAQSDNADDIEAVIDLDTRAVFCESVGNPAGNVADIRALADVAHRHGIPLIVDNTVATPIPLRPIDVGADIVVQSLIKFMGGHGTTLGGAIVDSGNFPWCEYPDRYPMFSQPDESCYGLICTERFGAALVAGPVSSSCPAWTPEIAR